MVKISDLWHKYNMKEGCAIFKKKIIKIITFFIPVKSWRKKARNYLICTSWQCMKFDMSRVRNNSVLLVEVNHCHGETLLGYVKYLLDLGYNVDILRNSIISIENPFCRFSSDRVRFFEMTHLNYPNYLILSKIKEYEFVWFNSSADYNLWDETGRYRKFMEKLDYLPKGKNDTLMVEHDLLDIKRFGEKGLLENNQITTLGNFEQGIMVNPHYFGDVAFYPKNRVTNFIVVGGILAFRKNHNLLIDAVSKLNAQKANFRVTIVGEGTLEGVPEELHRYIDIKGRLPFAKMYKQMEKADFFVPLLDSDNRDHDRYITSGVTGSAQLIYGFLKPCLIHEKFAAFYGFNDENAIVYQKDLASVMMLAINMGEAEYEAKREKLKLLTDEIYQKSLNNLKGAIKNSK